MDKQKLDQVLQKYQLTQRQKIEAARQIFSHLVQGKNKSCYPTAVIVAGQPGAGKTNLALLSSEHLPDAVMLDIDDFRPFHPYYDKIITNDPDYFAPTTNKFISEMSAIVTEWLIQEEYDMILHKTFKGDAVIFDTVEPLKMAGYNVIVQSLAVHGIESKLSAMERSQFERSVFGHCRWINFDYHDLAHDNLGIISSTLENNEVIDCAQVFVRGTEDAAPQLIYSHNISGAPNSLNTQNVNTEVFADSNEAIDFSRKATASSLSSFDERLKNLKAQAMSDYEMDLILQLEQTYQNTPLSDLMIVTPTFNDVPKQPHV